MNTKILELQTAIEKTWAEYAEVRKTYERAFRLFRSLEKGQPTETISHLLAKQEERCSYLYDSLREILELVRSQERELKEYFSTAVNGVLYPIW